MTASGEVVVDLDAIRDNTAHLVEVASGAAVMAVVKGDAYGHGLVPTARAALAGGASWLGVAQLGEALALRAAGVEAPVLAWLYTPQQPLDEAVAAGIDLSVNAPWAVAAAVAASARTGRTARLHLDVDTGMSRAGATAGAWPELLDAALSAARGAGAGTGVARGASGSTGRVELVGVWSHLARSDEPGHPTTRAQQRAFADAVAEGERAGASWQLRHLANSAATLTDPSTHLDLVRPGLAVYGLSPVPGAAGPAALGLRPALRLQTPLALVKDVPAGQGVSYSHTYTTPTATRLGLVPLGYADGVPRAASGRGPVLVGDQRATTAGRICMDQFVVDLGPGSPARAGDPVVLVGDAERGEPTAQEWAEASESISWEVVTRLSGRLPRRYTGDPALLRAAGVAR